MPEPAGRGGPEGIGEPTRGFAMTINTEGTVDLRVDEARLEAFMGQMIGHMTGGAVCFGVWLGDELGLYRAMAGAGPLAAATVAERTGWLSGFFIFGLHEVESGLYSRSGGQRCPGTRLGQSHKADCCELWQCCAAARRRPAQCALRFAAGSGDCFWWDALGAVFEGERFRDSWWAQVTESNTIES